MVMLGAQGGGNLSPHGSWKAKKERQGLGPRRSFKGTSPMT